MSSFDLGRELFGLRFEVLMRLTDSAKPLSPQQLADAAGASQQAVSAALIQLEDAGLVVPSAEPPRRGRKVYWSARSEQVCALLGHSGHSDAASTGADAE